MNNLEQRTRYAFMDWKIEDCPVGVEHITKKWKIDPVDLYNKIDQFIIALIEDGSNTSEIIKITNLDWDKVHKAANVNTNVMIKLAENNNLL